MGRSSKSAVALAAAILLIAVGSAYALASSGGGVIHACANERTGALRLGRLEA
jgi:hypothetical protein